MSRSRSALAAVAAAVLAGAGVASAAGTQVTLADSGTPVSRLGAELTGALLGAQGFAVTRATYPSAAAADAAVRSGAADAYVTGTATLLERVLGRPKERDDAGLAGVLAAQLGPRGEAAVATAPYDDAPQVACRRSAVRAHRLRGLLSLQRAAPSLTYAATPEHVVRADGYAALRARFHRVIVAKGAARFDLVARGKAHCVLSSGVEPRAERLRLVAITDVPRRLAGTPQHGVLVAAQAYLATTPAGFAPAAAQAAALMTSADTRTLLGMVDVDGQDPAVVARDFLRGRGLVP